MTGKTEKISKEELQSLNEELITVNSRLEEKVSELVETTDVLDNLLSSTGIATLFLDDQFRIKRFTPATVRLFNLISTDVGRPISDISHKFHDPDFLTDAKTVLDQLTPIEREIDTEEAKPVCYVRCIRPFRTNDDRIDGVVITFVDITGRKEKEILVQRARSFAEAIVNTIHEPLLILDKRLKVVSANSAFYKTFRTDARATEGHSVFDIGNGQWNIPTVRTLLEEIIPGQGAFNEYEVTQQFPDIGSKTMLLNACRIEGLPDQPVSTLLAIKDISKRKDAEQAFIVSKNRAEEANQAKSRFLAAASHDLRQPLQALSLLNRVLTNTITDPRTLEILEKQTESIVSMGDLLDALLNLSKIQAGPIEPLTGLTDSQSVAFTAPPRNSVLLVDDDAAVLDATCLLLKSRGFQTVAATSGAEALALLAGGELQPHCVISDYRLPEGLTGTELIQRIRETLKRDIPAVVLTGDISPEAIQKLQDSGCRILYKPVRTNELFLAIEQMIGKQDQPASGTEKQTS